MIVSIEVNEDLVQIIQRRQRLMDSAPGKVTLSLIEAENQKLARLVCESYRKQVEWKV